MGFMDEIKKLTHPYSDAEEDDYDDYDDEPLDNDPPPASSRRSSAGSSYSRTAPDLPRSNAGKVVNLNSSTQLQVILVKPTEYTAAKKKAVTSVDATAKIIFPDFNFFIAK